MGPFKPARKQIVTVSAVVALAVLGWIVAQGESEAPKGPEPEPVVAVVPEINTPLAQATVPVSAPLAALPETPTRLEVPTEAPPESELGPVVEEGRVFGTVVLFDDAGVALPPGSGVLTWIGWKGQQGNMGGGIAEVPVKDGKWNLALNDFMDSFELGLVNQGKLTASDYVKKLQVKSLYIDRERVVVEVPKKKINVPVSRFVEVRAHLPPRAMLHVFDALTGEPLSGLTLASKSSESGFNYLPEEHPGLGVESRLLARDQRSPIDLSQRLEKGTLSALVKGGLFVVAEGYAWAPVEGDLRLGGEFEVALRPGGDLILSVVGYDPEARGRLRVRVPDQDPKQYQPLIDQSLRKVDPQRITGLPVGEVDVAIEVGDWYEEPLSLGHARASIRAGEVADLTIEVESAPELVVGTASGLLLVPESWERGSDRPLLSIDLIGTALAGFDGNQTTYPRNEEKSDRPGVKAFRWTFKSMQVGEYVLRLHDPDYSTRIEVPVGGREDFVFEIPPRVELLVRVVNERTGEDLVPDELSWHAKLPSGVNGWSPQAAEYNEALQHYRIFAPATEVRLKAMFGWDYAPAKETVDLAAGVSEHTLLAKPASLIDITLLDGETPVAFPEMRIESPEPIEGTEGRSLREERAAMRWRFMMSAPGRYRFELPEIKGFQPVEPLTIDLADGETWKEVVELRRL